jgi:phasin family protein
MEPHSSPANLTGEIAGIVAQLKLPGLSVPAVMEARRKDIEALAEANRIALAGAQDLALKQREILQQAVRQLQALVLERKAEENAGPVPAQFGDLVGKALQDAFGNMRDLAELARKSQSDAFDVVSARVQQNIEELRTMLLPRSS